MAGCECVCVSWERCRSRAGARPVGLGSSPLPACRLTPPALAPPVTPQGGKVTLERRADLLQRAEPRICAFDIGGAWGARSVGVLAVLGRLLCCSSSPTAAIVQGLCASTAPNQPSPAPSLLAPCAETTKLPLQFPNAEYDQARGEAPGRAGQGR